MNILIFGAGRSAYFTIEYLVQNAPGRGWKVTVADASEDNIRHVQRDFLGITAELVDVHDETARKKLLKDKAIVISLLPARFHILVARDCLEAGINLITPSYLTPDLKLLDQEVKKKGLCFLTELGLDPGIDHLSAMKIIDKLKKEECKIFSFHSWTGGLISRKNDTNSWHYKFSWAPYNVIRAGQDGALFQRSGQIRYIPYQQLFKEIEKIEVGGEYFEGYYNRNSLPYRDYYGLHDTEEFIRGTLRYPGFCGKWDKAVQAGITADKVPLTRDFKNMSFHDFLRVFNAQDDPDLDGLSDLQTTWNFADMTPAEAFQKVLEKKWEMKPDDRDRIVMLHELGYEYQKEKWRLRSWFDLEGESRERTAMAMTVGLPLALAAELMAEGKLTSKGVLLPITEEIYEPLLTRLKEFGVVFNEKSERAG